MTLLLVHSYGGARKCVWEHYSYYKNCGAAIVGVNRVDTPHDWPEGTFVESIGKDQHVEPDKSNLPTRLCETLRIFLEDPRFTYLSHCCVAEYDTVFLAPCNHQGGFAASSNGKCPHRWKVESPTFIHPPWWFDRGSAKQFMDIGFAMIRDGRVENGSPDVFAGLVASQAKIPVQVRPDAFSINGRDAHVRLGDMVDAVRRGARIIHGVNQQHQLNALLDAMPK